MKSTHLKSQLKIEFFRIQGNSWFASIQFFSDCKKEKLVSQNTLMKQQRTLVELPRNSFFLGKLQLSAVVVWVVLVIYLAQKELTITTSRLISTSYSFYIGYVVCMTCLPWPNITPHLARTCASNINISGYNEILPLPNKRG